MRGKGALRVTFGSTNNSSNRPADQRTSVAPNHPADAPSKNSKKKKLSVETSADAIPAGGLEDPSQQGHLAKQSSKPPRRQKNRSGRDRAVEASHPTGRRAESGRRTIKIRRNKATQHRPGQKQSATKGSHPTGREPSHPRGRTRSGRKNRGNRRPIGKQATPTNHPNQPSGHPATSILVNRQKHQTTGQNGRKTKCHVINPARSIHSPSHPTSKGGNQYHSNHPTETIPTFQPSNKFTKPANDQYVPQSLHKSACKDAASR